MSIKNFILSHSGQFNHYKNESTKLKKENKKLKKQLKNAKQEIEDIKFSEEFEDGISIIIPSYKGENHIKPLLDSFEEQTLEFDKYEIIFIINGELDSTINILKDFAEKNKDMNVIITYTKTPGVSNARNIGLKIAKKQYTGFIDDDDFISPNYLKSLYSHASPNRVVMSDFVDVNEETGEEEQSPLRPFSAREHGVIKNAPVDFQSLSAITTAKILPTYAAKSVKFNTELKNGVDISYYSRLYPKFDFEFYLVDRKEDAKYYRLQRTGSISRQNNSYEFNVLGRLKVIDDIDSMFKVTKNKKYIKYLKIRSAAQTGFIVRYLKEHPEDKEKVLKEIEKHNYNFFAYYRLESMKVVNLKEELNKKEE